MVIEKIVDVLWPSLRDAYRVLEQDPDSADTKSLREALGQIFQDVKAFGAFLGADRLLVERLERSEQG